MPSAARLSVGALGLAIVLLVSAAWGTGLWYLVARLGLPSAVQLAWMDGVHAYVGLVAGLLVADEVRETLGPLMSNSKCRRIVGAHAPHLAARRQRCSLTQLRLSRPIWS